MFRRILTSPKTSSVLLALWVMFIISFAVLTKGSRPEFAIVKISLSNGNSGTGFFIDSDTIITNHHVIEGFEDVIILLDSGESLTGKVFRSDPFKDLAIIKLEKSVPNIKPFSIDRTYEIGDKIEIISHSFGMEKAFDTGKIISIYKELKGSKLEDIIVFTGAAGKGGSGSPLLDSDGEVIGVFFAEISSGTEFNLAIPAKTLKEFIEE